MGVGTTPQKSFQPSENTFSNVVKAFSTSKYIWLALITVEACWYQLSLFVLVAHG